MNYAKRLVIIHYCCAFSFRLLNGSPHAMLGHRLLDHPLGVSDVWCHHKEPINYGLDFGVRVNCLVTVLVVVSYCLVLYAVG